MTSASKHSNSKTCGGCTACCTIMGVAAVEKPFYVPCQHICGQGCAIYSNKPGECDVWECAWKSGWIDGDERRRPDNLGVMFEFRLIGGSSFLWVYEVWPNAFEDSKVKYLLNRLETKEVLVMCKYGSMRAYADPAVLDFLWIHGCGTQDSPLVPLMPLVDDKGSIVGELITERVGTEFVMKRILK